MNIAMLGSRGIPANYSGVETVVEEISKRLAERGHKVMVYCRPNCKTSQRVAYNKNIRLVTLPTINTKHLGTIVHVFLSTLHILFKEIDVVHFQALGPSIFSFLPRLFGKKTVVTVQALDWQRKKWGPIAQRFLKLCEYSSIYFPHRTIVVSKRLKNYFEEKFKKKVHFIPYGVEISQEIISSEYSDEYRLTGLEENKYILFVGRLVPEKGVHHLIKAFNEIKTDMKLVIVGESSFTNQYVKFLKEISNSNVIFIGFVKGRLFEELYKGAYIFVLPSEVEGLSISLLEAMKYGKCVLTSDIPECLEVIEDAGFYFKLNDEMDLSSKLQILIDNPKLVEEKGLKARIAVIKKYNWDAIIDEIERLYFLISLR